MSLSCYENNHGKFIGICLVVYKERVQYNGDYKNPSSYD